MWQMDKHPCVHHSKLLSMFQIWKKTGCLPSLCLCLTFTLPCSFVLSQILIWSRLGPSLFTLLSGGCIYQVKLWPVNKGCKRDKTEGVQQKKSRYQRGTKAKRKKEKHIEEHCSSDPVATCVLSDCLNRSCALEQIKVSYRCRQLLDWWMAVKNNPPSAANSIFAEWQIIRKKKVVRSINHEALQTQTGMQHTQKLIHATQKTKGTVFGRKLSLPYCLTHTSICMKTIHKHLHTWSVQADIPNT